MPAEHCRKLCASCNVSNRTAVIYPYFMDSRLKSCLLPHTTANWASIWWRWSILEWSLKCWSGCVVCGTLFFIYNPYFVIMQVVRLEWMFSSAMSPNSEVKTFEKIFSQPYIHTIIPAKRARVLKLCVVFFIYIYSVTAMEQMENVCRLTVKLEKSALLWICWIRKIWWIYKAQFVYLYCTR